jgi:copper chaperone NosL
MTQRLHPFTRALLAVAVLSLISGYFVPLWQIQLWAPQYPEGLNMKIWIDRLSGAFDIISGLNHYIGMRLIKEEMFPEFGYMIYLFGALIAVGLFAVVRGTRTALWFYVSVLALGGLAGLVDFYRWGWDYGHNLNPNAPIQVPGMSYQPPLVGYKNLLNFTAYSGPDIGGWIMIASGALSGLLLGWEQFLRKRGSGPAPVRESVGNVAMKAAALLLLAGTISGCDAGPQPIRYGQDECSECGMIISDRRFGAETITRKGKVFKFDDIGCMVSFLERAAIPRDSVKSGFAIDFNRANSFIALNEAVFLKSERLKSPMRSDCAAFATTGELEKVRDELGGGTQERWSDLAARPF